MLNFLRGRVSEHIIERMVVHGMRLLFCGRRGALLCGALLRFGFARFLDVGANLLYIDGRKRKPVCNAVYPRSVVGVYHHVHQTVWLLFVHHGCIENAIFLCFLGKDFHVLVFDDKYFGGLAVKRPHARLSFGAFLVFQDGDEKCGKRQNALSRKIGRTFHAFDGHVGCHVDDLFCRFSLLAHALSAPFL